MDGFYDGAYSGVSLMLQYLPRIRDLSVLIDREEFDNLWDSTMNHSAPTLEVLRVEAIGSSRARKGQSHRPLVVLESRWFKAKTPRLRSLTLTGVELRLTDSLLRSTRSLRHLEITDCVLADPHEDPTMDDLLDTLRNLPKLETLKLDWSLESAITDGNHTPPPLPNLKLLHLTCTPSFLVTLVRHLALSQRSAVTVHYRYPEEDEDDDEDEDALSASHQLQFKSVLGLLFKESSVCAIAYNPSGAIQSSGTADVRGSCQLWTTEQEPSNATEQPDTSLPLSLPARAPRFIFEDLHMNQDTEDSFVITTLIQSLDLSNVRAVYLAGPCEDVSFARTLKDAYNTATARIAGPAAPDFVSDFSVPIPDGAWAPYAGSVDDDGSLAGDDEDAAPEEQEDVPMVVDPPLADAQDDSGTDGSDTAKEPASDDRTDVAMNSEDPEAGGQESEPDAPSAHWPNLRTLQFENIDLSSKPTDVASLLACLHARKELCAADILRIDFEQCSIADMAELAPLAAAVPEIRWNKKVVSFGSGA